MSLFSNLRTASSGLQVAGTQMSIIGDNIANVNTIGFKRGRATFSDSFPVDVSYVHGPISIGTGAYVGATNNEFSQGAIQISNNNLHMAINGNGFFPVRDGENINFTRNGEFYLNNDGFLTTSMGLRLQGFLADDGTLQPQMGDIQVNLGHISSRQTEEITLAANINSDADDSTTPLASYSFDGITETITDAANDADYATSVAIFDSLGGKHDVTLAFEKTSTNAWTIHVLCDGGELIDTNGGGATVAGMAFQIASIDVTFDTDGSLTSFNQTNTSGTNPWNFVGAEQSDFNFNIGLDAAGDENSGNLTQLASVSTMTSLDQDGYTVGHLTSMQILTDGRIQGKYDNGQDITLGAVAVAEFDTTTGLERTGANSFRATRIPGEPTFGRAGEGGRGDIFGSSLETSNVDIEDEFVKMITSQRTYQANSRVMSATNELLRELVNLV